MSVLLGTICLNEMEWLPRLVQQHRHWPDVVRWVFVEAADSEYARINPELVSPEGLSVDGTSEFLRDLAATNPKVVYIPHGVSHHSDPAKCKIPARQRYMDVAAEVGPQFLVVLDADEFYTYQDQERLITYMRRHPQYDSFIFPRRDIWRPPSIIDQPLMQYEVVDGFWGIPCCHWWRWGPGVCYKDCHNTPERADGTPLNSRRVYLHKDPGMPQMVHMGFAAERRMRAAKNRYYAGRGEAHDKERRWYVKSRKYFETWRPRTSLPNGAKVIPYNGPVPEVFREEQK